MLISFSSIPKHEVRTLRNRIPLAIAAMKLEIVPILLHVEININAIVLLIAFTRFARWIICSTSIFWLLNWHSCKNSFSESCTPYICVGNPAIIGRRQTIIWTNAGILFIGHLGTNFSEILIEIHAFSFTKMPLKPSSAKCQPFCLGLNMLTIFKTSSDHDTVTCTTF